MNSAKGGRKSLLKWTAPRRYASLTSIWILGTIPFSSRRSGQATMETNGRTRSPVVVIWRYSPDSHARPVRTEAGERKGMRKCDDCTIGKECQPGGEKDRPRESELERERGSTVVITVPCIQMVSPTHTNHNEHPRTSPIPLSNAKGTNTERTR